MTVDTTTLRNADATRVELYHCASMHGTYEQQRRTIARLEALDETALVDETTRHAWAHTLTPQADDEWCERSRGTYARFREWAADNGRSLEPAFSTRTVSSLVEDEAHEVVSFPVLAVAVYADDDLVHVAPSTDPTSDTTETVADCLDGLEAHAERPRTAVQQRT